MPAGPPPTMQHVVVIVAFGMMALAVQSLLLFRDPGLARKNNSRATESACGEKK